MNQIRENKMNMMKSHKIKDVSHRTSEVMVEVEGVEAEVVVKATAGVAVATQVVKLRAHRVQQMTISKVRILEKMDANLENM